MFDTISGAKASSIIYSLAETAKANNLKPYEYFKYLLEEILEHMDDKKQTLLKNFSHGHRSFQNRSGNDKPRISAAIKSQGTHG